MKKFAFYGTLRLDQPNYHRLLNDKTAKFLGTKIVDGYAMFNLGYYPTIIPEEGKSIVVELFELSDDYAIKFIKSMELGAGYKETTITHNGDEYTLYVCGDQEAKTVLRRNNRIESGDWVSHISVPKLNDVAQ